MLEPLKKQDKFAKKNKNFLAFYQTFHLKFKKKVTLSRKLIKEINGKYSPYQ